MPGGVEELGVGPPGEVVAENAYRKALAAVELAPEESVILGVDTVVALGTRIYGKPADLDAARATLSVLGGRRHTVMSGVCVIDADRRHHTAVASTIVQFRALSPELLEWYLQTGEWRERAGGYAIQGRGAALVSEIVGDYTNVVGLPVVTLLELIPALLQQ